MLNVNTQDGMKLEAAWFAGGDAHAPLVVLAHRQAGSHAEWGPLVERLLPPKSPMNLVAIDLRGHGGSTTRLRGGKKLSWNEMQTADFLAMANDVTETVRTIDRRPGGQPDALILVGSDVGATAIAIAAKGLGPRVQGLALVSPGAALRGVDLYKPFSLSAGLPNLVVTATQDATSMEPSSALAAMSTSTKLVRIEGREHSAEYLGRVQPFMWDDVADWVDERVQASPLPQGSVSASSSASAPPPGAAPLPASSAGGRP
jgi:pimeloyl-ACP methyl ester carboxylesterase